MTIVRTTMAAVLALGVMTTASVIASPSAEAAQAGSKGSFTGKSKHVTSGGVSIVKSGSGYALKLAGNFSLDGAPDPWLGFGTNGKYSNKTTFAVLKKNKGGQTYKIPASVDISKFNEVYVWCKKFGVPLGVAKLK